MSVFNLIHQNTNLDNKITAGLERLSQVFRILLWEKAKEHGLSPIQVQLLIFIKHHSVEKTTVSYLSKEFNVTKPTISDSIKILEQKYLIKKKVDGIDTRSYTIKLTAAGNRIVAGTEDFANPLTQLIVPFSESDKVTLWQAISTLIIQLNKMQVINVQRTCFKCRHYCVKNNNHFCNLLLIPLQKEDIRIDCPEFSATM